MNKKPKSHRCKDCDGALVSVEFWDEHVKLHKNQIDMFPDMPRIEREKVKRQRRKVERLA